MTRTCEAPMKFGCTTLACHLFASSGFSLFLFLLPVDSFDQSRAQKQKNENSSKIIHTFRFVDYKTIPFTISDRAPTTDYNRPHAQLRSLFVFREIGSRSRPKILYDLFLLFLKPWMETVTADM